jgi:membrane-associated phospholipid phosphatase
MFKKIFFLCLFLSSFLDNAQNVDFNVLNNINVHRNKSLDSGFKTITNSVIPVSIATPILIYSVGLIHHDSIAKQKALFIGESFLASAFITTVLKDVIRRERPYVKHPEIQPLSSEGSYSMPSGHTSTAFATATSLSIACPKWYVVVPSFVWASSVGYSRMHLGVHYPSDVLVGAVVGSGSVYVTRKLNQWLDRKPNKIK